VKNKKNLNEKGTIFLLKNRKLYELLLYAGSHGKINHIYSANFFSQNVIPHF
jgi:hypothetical protein